MRRLLLFAWWNLFPPLSIRVAKRMWWNWRKVVGGQDILRIHWQTLTADEIEYLDREGFAP